jgi:aminopeptidase N
MSSFFGFYRHISEHIMKKTFFQKVLVFTFLLLSFSLVIAQRKERLLDTWQPTHFDVNLIFNDSLTELTSITTEVTILVRKNDVSVIDLDFGKMPVKTVTVDGTSARFEQHDDKLDVYLAHPANEKQQLKIAVTYSGKPADGLILKNDRDGLPSAIGDNWPDRVHHWIPCFDHPSAKASVRFTVTAPAKDDVTANGVMESKKDNGKATRTWIYTEKNPISPYNMVVAVGQFADAQLKVKKVRSAIPILYYVTHSDGAVAEKGFSSAPASVDLFSRLVAPYPYGKLALIVGATRFGGMENANTIVFAPDLFKDFASKKPRGVRYNIPSGVEGVVAHEIAHQWFGDSVTEATWADLWLSEGFATYFAGLFLERYESKVAFRAYMKDNAQEYFAYEKQTRTPIHDTETEDLFALLNKNNYEKGSWVLHELRGILGDKSFFAGLKIYYNAHKGGTATSEDLREAFEKASGKDLKDFFTRWIYRAGHPVYKISWTRVNAKTIELKLDQSQPDEAFLMPVTVEITTARGKRRVRVTPTGKTTLMKVQSLKPAKIIIDPDEFILKEVISE